MQNQQPHSREAWASILDWSAPMPLEVTIRGRRVASDATPAEGGRRVAFRGAGKGTSVRAIGIGATRTTRTLLSRSEEHQSELKSLLRTWYAVFFFKKKK